MSNGILNNPERKKQFTRKTAPEENLEAAALTKSWKVKQVG